MHSSFFLILELITGFVIAYGTMSDRALAIEILADGRSGSGRTYFQGAGDYKQVELSVNSLAEKKIEAAQIVQKEDKEYILSIVSELHQAYVDYAKSLTSDQLFELEASGIAGNPVSLRDFLKATADLKLKTEAFQSLLIKSKAIKKETLPSNYSVIETTDGKSQPIPLVGNVDLTEIIEKYKNLVKDNLDPLLASYTHIKINIDGKILTKNDYGDILKPNFSMVNEFNLNTKTKLTEEMNRFLSQSRDVIFDDKIKFTNALRNEYNGFTNRFGSSYQRIYRPGSPANKEQGFLDKLAETIFGTSDSRTKTGKGNTTAVAGLHVEDDFEARDSSFRRLIDTFWIKSYLRLKSGIQLCAVQPKEFKPQNNLNILGRLNLLSDDADLIDAMKQLRAEPACSKDELEDALQNARNILIYSGLHSDFVFNKDSSFLEVGLLNKLGSAVTFALGKRPVAEAVNMLIQLVYADIQEELIMATPGRGLRALRDMYSARYQSSKEQKDYYSSLKCSYDKNIPECANQTAYDETPGAGASDDDIRAVFLDLQSKIYLAKDYIDQASLINQELMLFRSNQESSRKAIERSNDL